MDVSALLEPRDDEAPSGEDLRYDATFAELQIAAQPPEDQEMGDQVLEADATDFREVKRLALEILERSHDLRAAVLLAQAELSLRGFEGFAEVTAYMRGCLEQYWETCHPELDEDDGDPMMRANAVLDLCGDPDGLGGPSAIYQALRRTPLTESRTFGRISVRDIQIAEGEATARDGESVPDGASVNAAFQDTDDEKLAEIMQAIKDSSENVELIAAAFDEHVPGQGPDLNPLIALLRTAKSKMSAYAGSAADTEEDTDEPTDDVPVTSGGGGGGGGGGVGGINSQNDVINALDRIMEYYRRAEPSSPVPLLLDRAKRLVNADFVTIVKDMAPQGVENVNLIGGLPDEEY